MGRDEPHEVAGAYERPVHAHDAGDMEAAEGAFHESAAKGDPDAAFQLGVILADRGDYLGAAEAYEQAAAVGHLEATLNLALLFRDVLDRPDDARELYRTAIDTGDLRAVFDFGFFLWREGDTGGAEAAFQQAIDAGEPRGHLEMAFLLADQQRDEEALAAFERAVALALDEAWTQVGWQLARLGRLDEAEQALRRAREAGDPASAEVLRQVLDDLGHRQEADAVLSETIDGAANEISLEYREILARLDGESLRAEELERWARQECHRRTPLVLAGLLFDAARLAEAETRLKLAIQHEEEESITTLADLYETTGRHGKAQALRKRGLR